MFKVVPDQLRISEGWVRCGHCTEVFDASAHLQDPLAPPVPPARAESEPTVQQVEVLPDPAPEPYGAHDVAPATLGAAMPSVTLPAAVMPSAATPALGDAPAPDSAPNPPEPPPPEDEVALHDVPFVRAARRKAFWRRPLVRSVLSVLLLVLLAALTLQVAVQERDRLAELRPELRPLLLAVCEPLHCTLSPPRQIEAVVIEGSTFTRLRPETYRLAFTLKNQSAMTIAMPAVELTLTDSQDQTVVRRVLTPAELGSATGVIAGGSEWAGAVAMAVAPTQGAGRVAGYRVLAFYP